MGPLFDPADFRLAPGIAHVCAAGETPFLHSHDRALLQYAGNKDAELSTVVLDALQFEAKKIM